MEEQESQQQVSSPAVSAHIASLLKSLAVVPSAAAPAIIDCVLVSSSFSPSALFSLLLEAFAGAAEPLQSNYILSYTSCLCHLIKKTRFQDGSMRQLIWRVFLPLLKSINSDDSELFNQVNGLFCDLVSEIQSWDLLGATLVPFCLRSLGLIIGMPQNEDLAAYKWTTSDVVEQGSDDIALGVLPLQIVSHILMSLLESAMTCREEIQSVGQTLINGGDSLECFINKLTWDLSRLALGVLMQGSEYRSCAMRLLLPVVFSSLSKPSLVTIQVQGSQYSVSRACFSEELWNCCSSLFTLGHLERLDAFSILSLYFSIFYEREDFELSVDKTTYALNIIAKKEFWEEIRKGLVDKDPFVRKQALYILKIMLRHYSFLESQYGGCCSGNSVMVVEDNKINLSSATPSSVSVTKREKWADTEARSLGVGEVCHLGYQDLDSHGRWKVFILLYEMLEEYGTHLVEAAWRHQVSLLFQSRLLISSSSKLFSCEVYESQMENLEAIFSWLAVLWERGFCHENPQVRSLIMDSFLCIDWENVGTYAQKIPTSFVLGPLTQALNDVVHHNDFGIKGVYTSKTIEHGMKFYHEFSRQWTLSDRAAFVRILASVLLSDSFGRAGLMALALCMASAACHSVTHSGSQVCSDAELKSTQSRFLPCSSADLLDSLGIIIERSKQHFNPNYRLKVCAHVLKAASSLINIVEVQLDLLLHFISTVPREFTDHAGSLRVMVRQWLMQSGGTNLQSSDAHLHVLNNLINFPSSFITQTQTSASVAFDDEDVDLWGREAQRWARVLFLVITEEEHMEAVFMFLQKSSSCLCKRDSCKEWVPIKFLILIFALVEELQVGRSDTGYSSTARFQIDSGISDHFSSLLISIYDKSTETFLPLLEELVSYAKLVSPTFWSHPVVNDMQLPLSVKGKLGGPSQRRLPSAMISRVLQAIFSIRTVASISTWCNDMARGKISDSSFIFLWNFSWKAIRSSTYDSEAGAEICLAMYEALASVFKAFSTTFTNSHLDFVMEYNKTWLPNGEVTHLLDPLVLTFLHNTNNLLANGQLTRSRRAVLMNWKWVCLDSLLSIPLNVISKGHLKSADSLFSDSTLRSVFVDIVESLENAGESSVLPMLKSVRLVLGLLCSNMIPPIITPHGVTSEMMLQLAQSSWILHINCNKRRVAPIAALISAVLHESLFGDLSMHEMDDNNPGPIKWFIEKLLDDGKRSPRTIRLAALHLTGLWLLYPATIKYYIKELKSLTLYGSVAFDEDFEAELSENHEAQIEVSLLARSPDHEFTEVFINTEMYARASVAALFYKLANFNSMRGEREQKDAVLSGKMFLLELLDSVANEKDLAKELYKKYSGVHRQKVRAWQMICILSHFVEDDIVGKVTSNLHICLYRNNLPAVRQYLETFAIQIYLKFPSLVAEQLVPIFRNYNMRPQALSSYVFIAANVILHESELAVQRKHLNELLPPIIPLLTSHHHSLRGFTQLLVFHVLCKLWPTMIINGSDVASLEKKCFEELKSYLAENIDCSRLRASMEGLFNGFDPRSSATPTGVFDVQKEGSEFECVPVSLMEQVMDFLNGVREDLRHSIAKDSMIIKNESLTNNGKGMAKRPDGNAEEPHATLKDINLDFQKKITLPKEARSPIDASNEITTSDVEFPKLISDLEKEDQLFGSVLQARNRALDTIRQKQQQFILVASLIDRIPNLAGLARTCEVFKAAGLAIADASILQDKQFQLISVTAGKWVPIIEVPVCSIKVFLENKRQEGFSILGLEQTANSKRLDQYSFPTKTVLVLGREKEGIPVDIIHVLDGCVEIPQLGVIRSLNVHVSGAIALWEYTRQQRQNLS
ncbi:uncharacterized protein LOC103970039 isoform X1 [Musa acuminata AAA Group]|uniref:uncharacterized protein LOC103970039 isoform X1 n=2 Tax=Musa acuminata AAA Group TaxID=214697 RepID=UPI0031D00EF4